MLARVSSALGRLIALALFSVLAFLMVPFALLGVALMYALVLGLGLVSLVGLVGGPICLMAPLTLLGFTLVYALVLGLALASLVGLVGGPLCLLMQDYRTGLMLLGAGACAWVVNMFILDWVFGPRSGRGSVSIPASPRIDFDR